MTEDEQEYSDVTNWINTVRRIRLDGAVKGIRGATLKVVAMVLASYAEYADGSRVFPGIALLAVDCEINYQTAKRCVTALRTLGLIRLVRAAHARGSADEYRLTIPADLMDRLEVLSPAQVKVAAEKIRSANRRPTKAARTGGSGTRTRPTAIPTIPPVRVADSPVPDPADEIGTGGSGTCTGVGTGGSGTSVRVALYPPTIHDRATGTTFHSVQDQSTDLAVTRANPPNQDRANGKPTPTTCGHKLDNTPRPDGTSGCALCRRETATTTPETR